MPPEPDPGDVGVVSVVSVVGSVVEVEVWVLVEVEVLVGAVD